MSRRPDVGDVLAQSALRKFLQRDFRDWRGLAAETRLADVAAVCDVDLSCAARVGSGKITAKPTG